MSAPPSAQKEAWEGDGEIQPTRWENFIVGRPCCACVTFLAVAFATVFLSVGMFNAGLVELATQDQWDVVGDPTVQQFNSYLQAIDEAPSSDVDGGAVSERSKLQGRILLVYEVKEGSVLSEENLEKIRKVESKIVGSSKWQEHCLLQSRYGSNETRCASPNSVLKIVARGESIQEDQIDEGFGPCGLSPAWTATAQQCRAASFEHGKAPCTSKVYDPVSSNAALDADRAEHVRCMCCALKPGTSGCDQALSCVPPTAQLPCTTAAEDLNKDQAEFTFGEDLSCSDGSTKRARSVYNVGYPLPGYTSIDNSDDNDKMMQKLEEWTSVDLLTDLTNVREEVSDDNFNVYVSGDGIDSAFFQSQLFGDLFLALGSLVAVFLWLWFGTSSAFLATVGMTEIVMSIPISFFIWGVIQAKFLTFFTLCIIFLILGIGADDVFVLYDAYLQADNYFKAQGKEGTPAQKFAYALRRARLAMSVTSATTFFSLMSAALSPIPSIASFGMFGSFVVLFDFLLVISLFASAMVIWDTKLKGMCGCCAFLSAKCGSIVGGSGDSADALRPSERFFRDRWTPFINKFRVPIAVFWLAVLISFGCIAGALLRPTTEAPQFFRDEYGARWFKLVANADGFAGGNGLKVPVRVIMGINSEEPLDRSGTNARDPEDLGKPVYDSASVASLAKPAGQLALYSLCEAARSGSFPRASQDENCTSESTRLVHHPMYQTGPRVRVEDKACQIGPVCFIDWVRDYRIETGAAEATWHEVDLMDTLNSKAFSPGATDAEAGFPCGQCCQSKGWYVCKMKQVREAYGMQTFNAWQSMSNYYKSGDKLQWAFVSINSTLPVTRLPLKDTEEHYDDWSGFVDEQLKDVGAYQTCQHWPFMVMQRTLLSSAVQSIALCLVIAWIILCVATANWIMATLCLFCIVTILIVFAGFLPMYGYDLGIFETVGLIVVLGLSVDYTVHIGHCYNENRLPKGEKERGEERVHRVTHALAEMGISVTSGAATTLLASLFLLPAKFSFYHVMGIFMFTTVVISTFVSLTLLPALLLIFGPTQDAGDMACISKVSAWLSSRLSSLCSKK